jgi:hypothetical protein
VASTLFTLAIIASVNIIIYNAFVVYRGYTRSRMMILGVAGLHLFILVLVLTAASLFHSGLSQSAMNFGDDTVYSFAVWYETLFNFMDRESLP